MNKRQKRRERELDMRIRCFLAQYESLCEDFGVSIGGNSNLELPICIERRGEVYPHNTQQVGWASEQDLTFQRWTEGWERVTTWKPENKK